MKAPQPECSQLSVKVGAKVYRCGVDGQRRGPAKWPAKMSLELLATITDGSYPTRSRLMGGLSFHVLLCCGTMDAQVPGRPL